MLFVPTYLAPSKIEGAGLGLFAAAPIAAGSLIWKFDPRIDYLLTAATVEVMPRLAQDFIYKFGCQCRNDLWLLCGDDARFVNHGVPSVMRCALVDRIDAEGVALGDLSPGDEITEDYSVSSLDFKQRGFWNEPDTRSDIVTAAPLAGPDPMPEAQFEIKHFDMIGQSPDAVWLAVRGWHELIEAAIPRNRSGAMLVSWDHKAIVAHDAGGPVGVLTWSDQEHLNHIWINFAYVIPSCRRQGCHTALFQALVGRARELKRRQILSGSTVGNEASRAAQARQGRVETGVTTIFRVGPNGQEGAGHV